MAEQGAVSAGKYCRHAHSVRRGRWVTDAMGAPKDRKEAAALDRARDRRARVSQRGKLTVRDDPVLGSRQPPQLPVLSYFSFAYRQ